MPQKLTRDNIKGCAHTMLIWDSGCKVCPFVKCHSKKLTCECVYLIRTFYEVRAEEYIKNKRLGMTEQQALSKATKSARTFVRYINGEVK